MFETRAGQRPHLLLTNDDGADSPLFELLIETLSEHAELSIAVPSSEQSWKGKSMTRHGEIRVETKTIAGHPAYAISGTPADCVNIALHNLLEHKPTLVVSGINVGLNAGLSLVWASGTVGACLEGNIAGIPGLALSQQLSPETYGYWDQHRSFKPEVLRELKEATKRVMPEIWRQLFPTDHTAGDDLSELSDQGISHGTKTVPEPITLNVNLPFKLAAAELEQSYLGHSWYGQCYVGNQTDGFTHRMQPFERDTHPQADNNILARGHVSVTRLDMRDFGTLN